MRLDALQRLVEATDFFSFREIAQHALRARGFVPTLTEAPAEADLAVYEHGMEHARFAVRVSTDADWAARVREDAVVARERLGLGALLHVSSRRITDARFAEVADEVERATGVSVERLDAHGIASLAIDRRVVREILRALDVEIPTVTREFFDAAGDRAVLAFACGLFGVGASDFRNTIFERAVLGALALVDGDAERDVLLNRAAQTLGIDLAQKPSLLAALDRLVQSRVIHEHAGRLRLDPDVLERWRAAQGIGERAREQLLGDVRRVVSKFLPNKAAREDTARTLLGHVSALLMDRAALTARRATHAEGAGALRERVRGLMTSLAAAGVPDDHARAEVMSALLRAAQESAFGRTLMVGELFLSMTTSRTPQAVQALTDGRQLRVLMDASVVAPLLCALVHGPGDHARSLASHDVWRLLRAHRIPIRFPRHCLEEVANLLLDTWRLHGSLGVDEPDPDLAASQNAFVAHFVAMRRAGQGPQAGDRDPFELYLERFDTSRALAMSEHRVALNTLMGRLQSLWGGYGVEVVDMPVAADSLRSAQEQLAWAAHELNVNRAGIALDHDARTLAWWLERVGGASGLWALCTWDPVHHHLRRMEVHGAEVLEPTTLSDLLALAVPTEPVPATNSPLVTATFFNEAGARWGAEVWDHITAVEREHVHDAAIRREVRRFKEAWVHRSRDVSRTRGLLEAWNDWKARHLPTP